MLLHPLVVHFPIALWLTSALCDLLAWRGDDPFYRRAAYWLVGLGSLGALASIGLGWVDLLALERQGVGNALLLQHRVHGGVAYAATAAYLGNFGLRCYTGNRLTPLLVTLSVAGAILVGVTGYLGGELRNVM